MKKKILLWTLGNLEHKIAPTPHGIEKLEAKLLELRSDLETKDTVDIVWGPELSCQVIEYEV